jgi:hypothetical protein
MSQLNSKSWEKRGSGVLVITPLGSVRFNDRELFALNVHAGNPEAIAEIIAESQKPKIMRAKKYVSGKRPLAGA